MTDTESLKDTFLKEFSSVTSSAELQQIRARFVGKKGLVTSQMKALSSLPPEDRPAVGKAINQIKSFIEERIQERALTLKDEEIKRKIASSTIDISLPGYRRGPGHHHPITQVLNEVIDIFITMGFSIEEGPEVETDYYNFEALNIPKTHPARDMQDTFYVERPVLKEYSFMDSDVVLRTHTSPVQIRTMEKKRPPLRFIAPGKVYRCDADMTHTPLFHQVEGLMVDTHITFANLKAVLEALLHRVFSPKTPVRFRHSYFPFTEPSAEVDIGCIFCAGQGCRICKGSGWLEILGSGMVDPRVFENVGYDPRIYSGFAFGMGIERITMLKYGIDDIRLFFESDLRFLRQF